MTNDEQDTFLAAECVKRIRHELRELDAIASTPIPTKEIREVSNQARSWEATLKVRLTIRASRKGKADEQQSLSIQD